MDWGEKYAPKNAENFVKKWFSKLGIVECNDKKGNKNKPSYDYVIQSKKILMEVKFINSTKRYYKLPYTTITSIAFQPRCEKLFYTDLRKSVEHVCKNHDDFEGYHYGGVIMWDPDFSTSHCFNIWDMFDDNLPNKVPFNTLDWEYLVFMQYPTIDNEENQAFIYLKDDRLTELFTEIFNDKSIIFSLQNRA